MKYLKKFENSAFYSPSTSFGENDDYTNSHENKIIKIIIEKFDKLSSNELFQMKTELEKFATKNRVSFAQLCDKKIVSGILKRKISMTNENFTLRKANQIISLIKIMDIGSKVGSFMVAVLVAASVLNFNVLNFFIIISIITTVVSTISPFLREFTNEYNKKDENKKK